MKKTSAQVLREHLDAVNGATVAPLGVFSLEAVSELSVQLNPLLADVFALYMKTKNFHWHMNGVHFRDYHVMLDEQSDQIYAITDALAERVRKIGGKTLRSIGDIARYQRLQDCDIYDLTPLQMLTELRDDNLRLVTFMMEAHAVCDEYSDVATASVLEVWIDEAQRRAWFLGESINNGPEDLVPLN